jgi:hypothetical protein
LQAHHGHVGEEEKDDENNDSNGNGNENNSENQRQNTAHDADRHRSSSDTRVGSREQQRNDVSGVPVDPEKGRDVTIVTWFGDNDPEVSPTILSRWIKLTLIESSKLVHKQKVLCNFPHLLPDFLRLHRFRHLHCWYYGS